MDPSHDAFWRTLGYDTQGDTFLAPCVKPVQGTLLRFRWTHDESGTYTLGIRDGAVNVEIAILHEDLTPALVVVVEQRLLFAFRAMAGPL